MGVNAEASCGSCYLRSSVAVGAFGDELLLKSRGSAKASMGCLGRGI